MMHLAIALIRFVCRHPAVTGVARWCLRLATRALAGSLTVPESLVVHTGAFALAYVESVERRARWQVVCSWQKATTHLSHDPLPRG
jgi:uncharacterized membrane protein